jgi:hypothetical protein
MDFKPTHRFILTAQDAPRVQATLFALEPTSDSPCAHETKGLQRTFFGETKVVCTSCGRTLGDPADVE